MEYFLNVHVPSFSSHQNTEVQNCNDKICEYKKVLMKTVWFPVWCSLFLCYAVGLSNGFGDESKDRTLDDTPGRKVEPRRRCASESSISSSNSLLCNSR